MPIVNAGESMIRAFQMGLNEKRAEQDQVAEQERKKIEMDLLKHRIQQMKLEERISAWDMNVKGAEAQAKSFEGLPEAQMASAGMLEGAPAKDLSQTIAGLMPSAQGQPAPTAVAPIAANQPLPTRSVMAPGFSDPATGRSVQPREIRVRTREQQMAEVSEEAAAKEAMTTRDVGPGQSLVRNGKVVYTAPPDPNEALRIKAQDKTNSLGWARLNFDMEKETDLVTKGVAQWLTNNLLDIDTTSGPDPKSWQAYEENPYDPTANPSGLQPPRNRMSPKQKAALQLQVVNSARIQLRKKPYTELPKNPTQWLPLESNMAPDGMVKMKAPDGTTMDVPEMAVSHYRTRGAVVLETKPGR